MGGFIVMSQGLLMLKFSARERLESERSRMKGAVYPPLMVSREEQAVAMKDAAIRLKLQMLRFAAKCFWP